MSGALIHVRFDIVCKIKWLQLLSPSETFTESKSKCHFVAPLTVNECMSFQTEFIISVSKIIQKKKLHSKTLKEEVNPLKISDTNRSRLE